MHSVPVITVNRERERHESKSSYCVRQQKGGQKAELCQTPLWSDKDRQKAKNVEVGKKEDVRRPEAQH